LNEDQVRFLLAERHWILNLHWEPRPEDCPVI